MLSEEEPVQELPSHHGDVMMAFDNHDYDEPYFEPASKEEGLLLQLKELGIPIISSESIKYVCWIPKQQLNSNLPDHIILARF